MAANRPDDSLMSQAGKYLAVGMTLALSTALFLYLGTLADKKAGTEPLLTLVGAFAGAAAGFYNLYRTLVIEPRERSKRASEKQGGSA